MAVPSFDDFYWRVRKGMPDAKDAEIRQVYQDSYDKDPVLTRGPDFDTFWKRVQGGMPDATQDEAREVYDETYGAPFLTDVKRSVPRGFGALSQMAGAGLHFLGAEETGKDVYKWGRELAEAYPPARNISSEIEKGFIGPDTGGLPFVDINTSLLRPEALIPQMIEGGMTYGPALAAAAAGTAMGQPWLGLAAGGALAGTEGLAGEYMQNALKGDVNRGAGLASAGLVGALNMLPIARIPGVGPLATKTALKAAGKGAGPVRSFAARGAEEAITETLEEAVDPAVYGRYAEIPGALQKATAIMPATFMLGGIGGMVGRARSDVTPAEDEQLATLRDITEPRPPGGGTPVPARLGPEPQVVEPTFGEVPETKRRPLQELAAREQAAKRRRDEIDAAYKQREDALQARYNRQYQDALYQAQQQRGEAAQKSAKAARETQVKLGRVQKERVTMLGNLRAKEAKRAHATLADVWPEAPGLQVQPDLKPVPQVPFGPPQRDRRLNRKDYQEALQGWSNEAIPGRLKNQQVEFTGYEGTKPIYEPISDEEADSRPTGPLSYRRVSSANSPLIQSFIAIAGSVKLMRKAVSKALAGAKLGVREQAVVNSMLDEHQRYRDDKANVRRNEREAAEERAAIQGEATYGLEAEQDGVAPIAPLPAPSAPQPADQGIVGDLFSETANKQRDLVQAADEVTALREKVGRQIDDVLKGRRLEDVSLGERAMVHALKLKLPSAGQEQAAAKIRLEAKREPRRPKEGWPVGAELKLEDGRVVRTTAKRSKSGVYYATEVETYKQTAFHDYDVARQARKAEAEAEAPEVTGPTAWVKPLLAGAGQAPQWMQNAIGIYSKTKDHGQAGGLDYDFTSLPQSYNERIERWLGFKKTGARLLYEGEDGLKTWTVDLTETTRKDAPITGAIQVEQTPVYDARGRKPGKYAYELTVQRGPSKAMESREVDAAMGGKNWSWITDDQTGLPLAFELEGTLQDVELSEHDKHVRSKLLAEVKRRFGKILEKLPLGIKVNLLDGVRDLDSRKLSTKLQYMGVDTARLNPENLHEWMYDWATAIDSVKTSKGSYWRARSGGPYLGTVSASIDIYVGNHESVADFIKTLAHELAGHYGMELIVGKPQWARLEQQVRALALTDPVVRAAWVEVKSRGYGEESMAKEIIAYMAEEADFKHPLMQKVLGAIRNWMRRLGFDIRLSRNDLTWLVYQAAKGASTGNHAVIKIPKLSVKEAAQLGLTEKPAEPAPPVEEQLEVQPPLPTSGPTETLETPGPEKVGERGRGVYSTKFLQGTTLSAEQGAVFEAVHAFLDPKALQKQRRGTRTWEATYEASFKKAAEPAMVDGKPVAGVSLARELAQVRPGTTANAETLGAYLMMVKSMGLEMIKYARSVQPGEASPSDLVVFRGMLDRYAFFIQPLMGVMTEIGRSLNILRAMAPTVQNSQELLDLLGSKQQGQLQELMELFAKADSIDAIMGAAHTMHRATKWDKMYEVWINFLLSGPRTHAVNITSNALYQAVETAAHISAGALSRNVSMREGFSRLSGIVHGVGLGMKMFKLAWQTEQPQLNPLQKLEVERQRAIRGVKGKLLRTPGRLLLAEDEFFKGIAYMAEAYELATRQAMKEQRDGKTQDWRVRRNEIIGALEEYPEIEEQAKDSADKLTFTRKMTPAVAQFNRAMIRSKFGKVIVPFVRTPTNIVKSALEFMPFANVMMTEHKKLAGQFGPREKALSHARWTMGTGIMVGVMSLVSQGLMSGNGPDDQAEKQLLYKTGWQPYSVKHKGKWYKYNRFEPIGMLLGLAADMYEINQYASADEVTNIGSMIMGSLARNLADKTFLRGISTAVSAYSDPDRHMEDWLQMLASSAIPAAIGQYAYTQDPYMRQAQTVLDGIKARIPGERQKQALRIDIGGEPIKSTVNTYGSPFNVSQQRSDKLAEAMLRLGLNKSKPSRTLANVKLDNREYEEYARHMGTLRWQHLTPMVTSPQFQQMMTNQPEKARFLLEKAWDGISSEARNRYLYEHPDIIDRSYRRKVGPKAIASNYL